MILMQGEQSARPESAACLLRGRSKNTLLRRPRQPRGCSHSSASSEIMRASGTPWPAIRQDAAVVTDYRTTQLESLLLAARQRLAWLLWALLFLFSFYGNGSILTILLRRKLLRCTLPIYSFFFLFFQPPGYGRGSGNADGGGAVRALPLRRS